MRLRGAVAVQGPGLLSMARAQFAVPGPVCTAAYSQATHGRGHGRQVLPQMPMRASSRRALRTRRAQGWVWAMPRPCARAYDAQRDPTSFAPLARRGTMRHVGSALAVRNDAMARRLRLPVSDGLEDREVTPSLAQYSLMPCTLFPPSLQSSAASSSPGAPGSSSPPERCASLPPLILLSQQRDRWHHAARRTREALASLCWDHSAGQTAMVKPMHAYGLVDSASVRGGKLLGRIAGSMYTHLQRVPEDSRVPWVWRGPELSALLAWEAEAKPATVGTVIRSE